MIFPLESSPLHVSPRQEADVTVRVDEPDPQSGNMLLEQFGGANGELAAAMQYSRGLNWRLRV